MRSAVIILAAVSAAVAEAPYHLPRPAAHTHSFGYPSGPAPLAAPFHEFPQPRPPQHSYVQPASGPQPSPNDGYNYQPPSFRPAFVQPAPQPQPLRISYPRPQPQPFPISYPQPQPQPLPITYSQPQPSYGVPQQAQPLLSYNYPQTPAAPIVPLPAPVLPQPQAPLPQRYTNPQLPSQPAQYSPPLPLPSQPLTNAVSSYQSDSNQYSSGQAQTHSEALDDTVLSRVQNIIKENEHSSARNAGYLSLVSGISLENPKPSVEISSFVHSSPQNYADLIDVRSAPLSTSSSDTSSYDMPAVSAGSSQSIGSSANFEFLPQTGPSMSYGAPK